MSDHPRLAIPRPPDPRIDQVVTLDEFEPIARERIHPVAFGYVAGGAWAEASLTENIAAWGRYQLRPRVLVDVSTVDLATTILGNRVEMPLAIAPMAAHALAHPDAECATASAAAGAGIPFTLSTMSSRSIEEVAAAGPDGLRFFQLYAQKDAGLTRAFCERAAAAGYRAIVLTVDLPVLGYRERDIRNGWELDVPLGNFAERGEAAPVESVYETIEIDGQAALTWPDVARIRAWTGLPLVLKGIMTAEDARLAVDSGADAIVVSNHGARQLDRTAAPISVLPEIVEAVGGRLEIWVDGGVRRGLDVVTAIALGAQAVLIGRPMLYALAGGGEAGVSRALAIIREELEIAMALLGTPRVTDITRSHVAALSRSPGPVGMLAP